MDTASRVPDRRRVYAIGDIHGRDDLLARVHHMILDDDAGRNPCQRILVYLGDYVDRGPQSFEVLERLIHEPLAGFGAVHLRGNHEDMMLAFLAGPPDPVWLMNGGMATILSYGIEPDSFFFDRDALQRLRQRLLDALPPSHADFLSRLTLSHTEGDYLFVHAGVRPGRSLDAQESRDIMWIRGPFLASRQDYGKRIVHGHTITAMPEVTPNRIGIDTGAFHSGRLTCLVLEGSSLRFLHT